VYSVQLGNNLGFINGHRQHKFGVK